MIPSKPISTMILNIIQNDIVTTASKSTASELIDHAWIRLQIQNILNEMPGLYATDEQMVIGNYISQKKLNIKLYSPDKGYTLYPILDEYGNCEAIGISMVDFKGVENFYFYTSYINEKI
jgi:hypothetical protein